MDPYQVPWWRNPTLGPVEPSGESENDVLVNYPFSPLNINTREIRTPLRDYPDPDNPIRKWRRYRDVYRLEGNQFVGRQR